MRVTEHKLPELMKLAQAKNGDLVELYTTSLGKGGIYIVSASTQPTYSVDQNTGDEMMLPAVPVPPGHGGLVTLFSPELGYLVVASSQMRCRVHKGAAVVLDFVEGA